MLRLSGIGMSDVGKKVYIAPDDCDLLMPVIVTMVIQSPKGMCAIYDNIWGPNPNNMEHKAEAVRAFMEFSNGRC